MEAELAPSAADGITAAARLPADLGFTTPDLFSSSDDAGSEQGGGAIPFVRDDGRVVSEPLCFRSSQCPPPPETRSQHCRPRRRQPACRVHVSPSLIPHRLPPPLGPTGGRPLLNSSPPPLDSSPPPAAAAARVHGRQTAETGWGWGCFSPIAVCGVAVSRPSGTEHRAEGSRI
ncbi:hypothetical protein ZWY2020_037207 [Hordeum vulgare]|nr:hypothetical protein ZWY2020_037207 [Hordeum vulgare]